MAIELTPNYSIPIPSDPMNQPQHRTAWLAIDFALDAVADVGANKALSNLASVAINTALLPAANGTIDLGGPTLGFDDLFLAEGGVINWDNGDVTLTQTGNTLAFAGASTGYTFDAPVILKPGYAANTTFASYPLRFQNPNTANGDFTFRHESIYYGTPPTNDVVMWGWNNDQSAGEPTLRFSMERKFGTVYEVHLEVIPTAAASSRPWTWDIDRTTGAARVITTGISQFVAAIGAADTNNQIDFAPAGIAFTGRTGPFGVNADEITFSTLTNGGDANQQIRILPLATDTSTSALFFGDSGNGLSIHKPEGLNSLLVRKDGNTLTNGVTLDLYRIALSDRVTISGSTSGAVVLTVPAVAGTTIFALPGTNGTSGQFLQTDGSGNTSWQTVSAGGGGDALVANPLSQFAATTSDQLAGVLTDESGTAGGFVRSAGGALSALTGLGIRSTGAAFDLTIASSEVLTAGRTLSIVLNDAARTLTIAGAASVSGTNTGDQTNISGNAATVTTNANLTGHVTSIGNAAVLGSFTLAQLSAAVSDANIARIDAAQTFTGDQSFSGAVTGSAGFVVGPSATGVAMSIKNPDNIANFSQASFYPNSGTNVGSAFAVVPRGTGLSAGLKAQFTVFNTDFIADSSNYEFLITRAAGTQFYVATGKVGTGTLRPLMFSAGYGDGSTNENQLVLTAAGNIGIGVAAHGTSAVRVLGIANGTEPSTSPADMIQLYSVDLSAGNATLGIRTETAVVTETVVSDRTLSVRINGVTYKLCLKS